MSYSFPFAEEPWTDDWELLLRGRGMSCEIEFMAVGTGSKAGDAIIVRYGTPNSYSLMVVDGGDIPCGERMVGHIRRYCGHGSFVNHMVLTHSDMDHASGLREILRQMRVENLWLHVPWVHAREAVNLFRDKRWTPDGLEDAIRREYDVIGEIVDLAREQGTTIHHPFTGDDIGPFRVLSPTKATYLHLLPQFDRTPDPDEALLRSRNIWLGYTGVRPVVSSLVDLVMAKVQKWLPETHAIELLRDGGVTSPSNETSLVLYGFFTHAGRVLLTGDAGVNALTWAADYADERGLPLRSFRFVQVPHHGSRRNVGPTILNRVVGTIQEASTQNLSAYISAPPDDDTHPRRIVVNAFIRRGATVVATQGTEKIFYGGFPRRADYIDVVPLQFWSQVEEYD